MSITENVISVEERIVWACERAGRGRESVTLVAATKYATVDQIWESVRAGIIHIGENHVQEARDKKPYLDGVSWHMIGHLQTNKAKLALELFDLIHSVDSVHLAEELSKQASNKKRQVDILLEVNIARENTKQGILPEEVLNMLRSISYLPGCRVKGLMGMTPYSDNPEDSRPFFRALHDLRIQLQQETGVVLPHLSMGMTQDFEVAIEEGATMIRVGRAIYQE